YPFFFFNIPPTPTIYTLSLHDALPISWHTRRAAGAPPDSRVTASLIFPLTPLLTRGWPVSSGPQTIPSPARSENTGASQHLGFEIGRAQSELQSRGHLVCRLLLEKKKK